MSQKSSNARIVAYMLVSDVLAAVVAYFSTLALRFRSDWGHRIFEALSGPVGNMFKTPGAGTIGDTYLLFYLERAPRILLILILVVCVIYAWNELYAGRRFLLRQNEPWKIVVSNGLALLLFFGYFYLSRNKHHPRSIFVTIMIFNTAYCMLFRSALYRVMQLIRTRVDFDRSPAILVGNGKEADLIAELISARHPHGIYVVDRVGYDPESGIGEVLTRLRELVAAQEVDMIICTEPRLDMPQAMQVLEFTEEHGLAAKILSSDMGVIVNRGNMPADIILGSPLVHFLPPKTSRFYFQMKRLSDLALASLLSIVFLPLALLVALLIRLSDRGPVVFAQERIGVNRRPFTMYKFRTMRSDADEVQAEIEELNEAGAGLFKVRKDPRITLIGRFLRRFSLDELPQLINVVKGQMSLVGPRPLPRRDFENYYEEWHYSRHNELPGLTCIWQVSGRSELDFQSMCLMDVFYLRNQSVMLDVKLLARTTGAVLFAKGAY